MKWQECNTQTGMKEGFGFGNLQGRDHLEY